MGDKEGCSLMKEIKKVEESITTCYDRVYILKSKLRSQNITTVQKENLRHELLEVEKLLFTNKAILKKMHSGNRTTFLMASAFCLIIFIIWMLYHLAFNQSI